jgi:tetratricopeptide (TPR) repeat protein
VRQKLSLLSLLPASAVAVLVVGGLASAPGYAQQNDSQSDSSQQETRKTPAIRERVYTKLSQAQEAAENDDMDSARELLDEVQAMKDLNSYETAQMWNFYAFIYFNQENYPEALKAYEHVLEQPDLPLGLQTTTMYTVAQLYVQQEQYRKALDMLEQWFALAENPGPEPYYLAAQIHYQLEEYKEGIPPLQKAFEIAKAQGKPLKENWYRLLNVFYYQLEDYPNVIKVLRTMIDSWPKREYFVQLAGMYAEQGDETRQLALYETAYDAGWLTRGNELVNYAQMLLQADIPYKAATVLQDGLDKGVIESTDSNWRVTSQAWQLADEDQKAIPALTHAAQLTKDGMLDVRLAQSYQNLDHWQECADAARTGLRKGDLRRPDQANMILGACLFELKQYDEARNAFKTAANDSRSRKGAESWLKYIEAEVDREQQLEQAMRRG